MTEYSRQTLKDDIAKLGLLQKSRGAAIRERCIDCCGGSAAEVDRCHITACPVWPFRFGRDPWAAERVAIAPSEAQLAARAAFTARRKAKA